MKTILLTSAGMDVKEEILKILPRPANQINVAYITTASKAEPDTSYVEKDRKLLKTEGFEVDEVDIEGKTQGELFALLDNHNLIFIQGGNTFYLLKAIRESGFDKVIKKLINRGVIYVGVSAGTVICCPTIEVAGWKNLDRNVVNLKNLTGLNLIPFNVFVHYEPKWLDFIKKETAKSKYPIRILTNDQALLIQDEKITFVGKGEEVKI